MSPQTVNTQIRELEAVRRQTRMVRWGTTLAATAFTVICVGVMNNSVQRLFNPGPTQDQFVQKVSTNLQTTVVPDLQRLAVQTVTDSRPIVETEFTKLNGRVPEVAEKTMIEFELLQKELPLRSEKVLDKHFGEMMKAREAKLREVLPAGTTDEQLHTFLNNITDEGVSRLNNINHRLFTPHIMTMSNIATDMMKIEQIEAPHIKNEVPTWQMGLLMFDIARADMKGLEMPGLDGKKTTSKPVAKVAATKVVAPNAGTKPTAKLVSTEIGNSQTKGY